MKPKWTTVLNKLVPGSPFTGQNVAPFWPPLVETTFLKTTDHSWTKTILSRGGGGKMLHEKINQNRVSEAIGLPQEPGS